MLYVNGVEVTAGVSGKLIQSGVQLGNTIIQTGNAAVAHANGMGSILSGNLTLTGQTLQGRINSLSGFVGNVSGGLETRIFQTGNAAVVHANGMGTILSGNLTQTGVTLGAKINSLSGFVGNVSGGLETRITATGNAAVAFANGMGTILSGNLTQTGATLQGRITSLSGFVGNVSGGLEVRITATGNAAITHANGMGSILSGNLTQTGATLQGRITSLSGFVGNVSGGLEVRIAQTGSTAVNHANGIGTILSGNLTLTGSTLFIRDGTISGVLQTYIDAINAGTGGMLSNVVYTTGTQYISGTKYFIGNTYIDNLFVTGTQTVVNTQDIYVGNNWLVLNATGGARDSAIWISTGITGASATGAIIGFDVPSNTWVFGMGGYMTDLVTLPKIASLTDITNASGGLEVRIAQTGSAAVTHANGIGTIISGNLTQTGATLQGRINSLSGFVGNVSGGLEVRITATGNAAVAHANSIGTTISGNLTLTGQTLQGRINSLSGFVGNVSGGLETRIFQTGNAAVVYANGMGTILSGNLTQTGATLQGRITSLSGFVGNVSGGLEVRITQTGNAAVAHANGMGSIISGNLTQTGVALGNKINSLSGRMETQFVHRTGAELISGIKTFVSPIKVGVNGGTATGFFGNGGWRDNAAGTTDSLYLGVAPYFPTALYETNDIGLVYSVSGNDTTPSKPGLVLYNNDTGYGGWAPMLVFAKAESGPSSYKSALAAIAANTVSGSATSSDWIDGNLTFYVSRWGGSGLTPYMKINSSGFVGIGLNPNPVTPLHVSGGFIRSDVGYQSGAINLADILYPRSNPSGFITGLAGTGSLASLAYVNGMGTILSGNLTLTGQTLRALTIGGDTNLSGNINGFSGVMEQMFVHRTGNELVSGNKVFVGTTTITGGLYIRTAVAVDAFDSVNRRLYDTVGNDSLFWGVRSLMAENGILSARWGERNLYSDATTVSLNWVFKNLSGEWSTNAVGTSSGTLVNLYRLTGVSGALQSQITAPLNTIVYKTGEQYITGNKWFLGNTSFQSGLYETSSTVSANYTVKNSDSRIYCDNTALITLTVGSAVTNSGQMVKVKLINTGWAVLTGTVGQTFDGSPSYVLNGQYNTYQIHSNGANWYLW